jgi:hypothetical protein
VGAKKSKSVEFLLLKCQHCDRPDQAYAGEPRRVPPTPSEFPRVGMAREGAPYSLVYTQPHGGPIAGLRVDHLLARSERCPSLARRGGSCDFPRSRDRPVSGATLRLRLHLHHSCLVECVCPRSTQPEFPQSTGIPSIHFGITGLDNRLFGPLSCVCPDGSSRLWERWLQKDSD